MNDQQKKLLVQRSGIAGCVVVFMIAIGLIAASLRKVEETEFGLMYNVWSKYLDDQAESGGLFTGPPGFRFVKFPSTFVTVDLDARQCVSRDGLIVSISLTFQYQMIAENMFPVVERYKDFDTWHEVVIEAGLSAMHHSCSDFSISNFQNKRGEIQAAMEQNLRLKLEGTAAAAALEASDVSNSTETETLIEEEEDLAAIIEDELDRGVYAQAISLQLRFIGLPEEYSNAVRDKQSAEEDIALAQNQRQQETTKARTALLRAKEEARKIRETAINDANITLTEANLAAEETAYAFSQESTTIVDIQERLGLSTNGVLAYLANGLVGNAENLVVSTLEPAKLSRSEDLQRGGGGGGGAP